ncbi:hypothetical protein BN1221_01686c [Brenneria goodwinii]|uniref:Uncharacterized protein n=1 Tax=Brenneria goodwinii TaxID=1109412 RepID=A0A0G4JTM4_9GAMM|nr:hypothetical protein BN1221_01686c [Brenneria goodwinii]
MFSFGTLLWLVNFRVTKTAQPPACIALLSMAHNGSPANVE